MQVAILDVDYYLPQRVETNDDLQRDNPDWRMAELYEKSGIRSRHVAAEGETAADLGVQAAERLLAREIRPRTEIDYLIFCTQSPDYYLPSSACLLQQRLRLGRHVGAFDFNLGCSGFVYGLQLAKSLVVAGQARNVLLITADTYTKFIHPRDRTVRVLFGDGAAATLVGAAPDGGRIGRFIIGSDGRGAENLIVPSGGMRLPRSEATARESTDENGCTRSRDHLFMDGPAIFAFAISTVPRILTQLLAKAGLSLESVDWYVYHQANKYMLEHLARRSGIPEEKMLVNSQDVGNTVSASIPVSICQAREAGGIRDGHRLVLVGFGVGYSWAACDVVWGGSG